jgi:hypothetical protein
MKPNKKKQAAKDGNLQLWLTALGVFQSAVETIGLPGSIFFCAYFLLTVSGTVEQKRAAIDLFILGRGISQATPLVFFGILYVCTIVGIGYYHRRQRAEDKKEIERLTEWKRQHQTANLQSPLHHSKGAGTK